MAHAALISSNHASSRIKRKMPTLIRYFGSYLKSPKMVEHNIILFKPMLDLNWKICMVLEKPPENKEWLDEFSRLGVSIEYMPRPKSNFDFSLMLKVFLLCRKYKCDLIHCENMHTSPLIGAFFAGTKVRLWTKRSMNLATELGRKPTLRDKISISTRVSSLLSTRILAVSRKVKEELVSLGTRENKVIVFNNAFVKRDKCRYDRRTVRAKYGFSENDVVVSTIGHAVHVKGWDVLLEAFKDAKEKNEHLKLLIVGSYSDEHEQETYACLCAYIKEHNLEQDVVFTGYMYDIEEPLNAADMFVLSSRSEGFGNVLLEALVENLPCISTDVGIASEVIQEGISGFVVDVNDHAQITDKMLYLAASSAARSDMSKNAKVPDFIPNREQYAERNVALYKDLLMRK